MPSGYTTTDALADSLDTVLASARAIREFGFPMPGLVDRQVLTPGTGLSWREISLSRLTAQRVASESTELDNPQQMVDTLFTITPAVIGILVFISDRVALRINPKSYALTGRLAQNAIERLKDTDGLSIFDSASTTQPGAGNPLVSGNIRSLGRQGTSNTTEPSDSPQRAVLHGYQIRDIEDDILAGVGTYPVGTGLTQDVFARQFQGMIGSVQVYEDGNVSIDSGDDAHGGVFSRNDIVLVQGRAPRVVPVRNEKRGGGGTDQFHYDEFAYGIRRSSGVFRILSDAVAPTS